MDSNLKIILAEFEAHKGEFVICGIDNKLRRFVGIADGQEDYYNLTYDGRKLSYHTCVGRLVYLKGKVDDKDYNEWIRLAKLNDYHELLQKPEYKKQLAKHLKELQPKGKDTLLAGLYFDME